MLTFSSKHYDEPIEYRSRVVIPAKDYPGYVTVKGAVRYIWEDIHKSSVFEPLKRKANKASGMTAISSQLKI